MSTANSSLAFDEVNEQEDIPMLNLLVKSRHLIHKIQEESSADYVITGTITVSF